MSKEDQSPQIILVLPEQISNEKSRYQIFPDLLPEEFTALKQSIAKYGVLNPCIVDQDGSVIEGWHRSRACKELGNPCPTIVRQFESETERFELAASANGNRRHLTNEKKREVIARYLEEDTPIADNFLAELLGVSKNTVSDVREELEATCQIDKLMTLRGRDGKMRPRTLPKKKGDGNKADENAKGKSEKNKGKKPADDAHKANKAEKKEAKAIVEVVEDDLDEDEEEAKEPQAETEWPFGILRSIRSKLEHLHPAIAAIDWATETVDREGYAMMIEDVVLAANFLAKLLIGDTAAPTSDEHEVVQTALDTATQSPAKPTEANPATVKLTGKVYEVASNTGMWFFRAKGQQSWVAASDGMASMIEKELSAD